MKYVLYTVVIIVVSVVNAANWCFCKATGKTFVAVGGPQ